jgi:hypothetical protein
MSLLRLSNMTSESNMRRRTFLFHPSKQSSQSSQPSQPSQPTQSPHSTQPTQLDSSINYLGQEGPPDITSDKLPPEDNAPNADLSHINRQHGTPHPPASPSRPDSPPVQEQTTKHRRFSTLRFRNFSDSQLSLRSKQQSEVTPPLPPRTFPSIPAL